MNKSERALFELGEMDALAAQDSPVHARHPLAKLLATLAVIVTAVSFGKYDLSGLSALLLYPAVMFPLSGIPAATCARKLRFALPLVLAVGLFNPLFDRAPALIVGTAAVSGGVVSMLTLMLKGVICLSASFLLAATTPVDALCAALRMLRVPQALTALMLLTYRYVGVMAREVAVMTDAYRLRAPGQRGIRPAAWGSFLGQLLLRSMDRAQALYASMRLRGFHGEYHYAGVRPFDAKDAAWAAACIAAVLACRFVNVARLLGGLFVR